MLRQRRGQRVARDFAGADVAEHLPVVVEQLEAPPLGARSRWDGRASSSIVLSSFFCLIISFGHRVQNSKKRVGRVGHVLGQIALALLLLPHRLRPRDLHLELRAAPLDRRPHRRDHVVHVVGDVLLAGSLVRDLGRDHRDPHADLVRRLVYLVARPVDPLHRRLGDDVGPPFEEQGDAVGEAVDVDARADVPASQRHRGLDDKGVALEHARLARVRRHQIGARLLGDAQSQIVLPGGRKVVPARVVEARLVQQLVQPRCLRRREVLRGQVRLGARAEPGLLDEPLRVRLGHAGKLLGQERREVGGRRGSSEALDELEVDGGGMVLDLGRRGRHRVCPARKGHRDRRRARGATPGALVPSRHEAELELGVRGDDGDLPEVPQDLGAVVGPVPQDDDGHLRAPPVVDVGLERARVHVGLVAVDVDVELVHRHLRRVPPRGPDVDGQARAHLGPDQRHFGAQAKLPARLADAVFRAGEDAAEEVGDGGVGHAHAVVLDRQAVEGLGGLGGRGGGPGGELAPLGVGGVLAALFGGLFDVLGLFRETLGLCPLVLEVVVELLVEALDVGDAAELVEALLGDLLAVVVWWWWWWGGVGSGRGERERVRKRERKKKEKRGKRQKNQKPLSFTHIEISMSGSSLMDSAASSEFSTSSRIDV